MSLSEFRRIDIRLDKANDYIPQRIYAKQGDVNGRELYVQLTNNGEVANTTGTTLNLGWTHLATGGTGLDSFTIVDVTQGIYKHSFTTAFLQPGRVECSIQIVTGEDIVNSRTFIVDVDGSTYDETAVESDNSFTALQDALLTVSSIEGEIVRIDAQLAQIAILPEAQLSDIDDTASINRALSYIGSIGGGKVRIPYKTTPYIISDELLIHGNTTLEIDEGTVIKLADGANKIMLLNANKTTQSNLTIIDKNIKIIGGIWDGNKVGQTKKWYGAQNTTPLIVGFFFSGVENLEFKPSKIINTETYACLFCNVERLLIDNIETDVGDVNNPNNGDAIHIMGPSKNITITNSTIRSEDHAIALNANDVQHGPYTTLGDIEKVHIENIRLNNYDGGQGLNLLSGTYAVKDVMIKNITGKAAYLMALVTFNMGPGNYQNITLDGANVEKTGVKDTSQFPYLRFWGKMGTIALRNINIPKSSAMRHTNRIAIETTAGTPVTEIDQLKIENLTLGGIDITTQSYYSLVTLGTGVIIHDFIFKGLRNKGNVTPFIPLDLATGTIKNMLISDITADNTLYGLAYLNNIVADTIQVEKVRLGTKSINKIHYRNAGAPNIKKLVIRDCGNMFVRLEPYYDEIIRHYPQTLTSLPDASKDIGYYRVGDVINSKDPLALGFVGWVCTAPGSRYNIAWAANTSYAVDDVVRIGNFLVKCVKAGISGATTPTVVEDDFTDGTVTWRYMFNGIATFRTFGAITP